MVKISLNQNSSSKSFKWKIPLLVCLILAFSSVMVFAFYQKFTDDIPVLMYHSVKEKKTSEVVLTKKTFDKQLKYLKTNGFKTLTLDELYDYIKNGKEIPRKSVVLTFDDGYKDNYEIVYPLLKQYGFKATIFVQTNKIDKDKHFLTTEQIKELAKSGIEIGSHTVSHKDLATLSYEDQYKELADSKATLEKIIDKPVKYLAYPYGSCNEDSKKICKELGYLGAIGILDKYTNKESDGFEISRRAVIEDMDNFLGKVEKNNYYMTKYKVRKLFRIIKSKL
ncbi:polysaccharide deacetylase family protein [Clostridium amazonitimonense]|uniref:polysaccharide deacetylase family protein n=1 Tax=Clostridium amazonitimonense TaxID=1499689 RepID=UPI0009DF67F2|nr:polysaccharide deacetylase family protein [Clostridium amazonitimonense]